MNTIYRMIHAQVKSWVAQEEQSNQSLVKNLLHHIDVAGKLRPPQKEAVETYLWIKFIGKNKKLSEIIKAGLLHDENSANGYENYRALAAFHDPVVLFLNQFFQDNLLRNLQKKLLNDPCGEETDWDSFLDQLLHDFDYANYLYSLPMGAGKTFLMACFIYLDLYFANLFKNDHRFAHNFIVFAPHASKTAILPSLKTIKDFNPEWLLPKKDADKIKQTITFEILDKLSSARRDKLHGNNPNLEKVNRLKHTQKFGLVFITNAEKVVLERYTDIDKQRIENAEQGLPSVFNEKDLNQIKKINELREALSMLPNLSVILDEVHHAYGTNGDGDKKLRQAIDILNQHNNLTVVLGLSGTPYVKTKINIANEHIRLNQIQDTVYHYALNTGIGKFLKKPTIVSEDIVESAFLQHALSKFFTEYDTQYANGTKSKIAFYCPSIKNLNEEVLPVVQEWYRQNRSGKEDEIFRYYSAVRNDQKQYKLPKNSNAIFNNLDQPHSNKRVILLVAIGKEGWDCRSLTSVVLPRQKTPKNFVLQTTCRCLREVDNAATEAALIYLSADNYDTLDKELRENYQLSISDLSKQDKHTIVVQVRKPRLGKLKYKQIKYQYKIVKPSVPQIKTVLLKFKFAEIENRYPYDATITTGTIGKDGLINEREGEYEPNDLNYRFTYAEFLHLVIRACYGMTSESELETDCAKEMRAVHAKIAKQRKWITSHPHIGFTKIIEHLAASFMEQIKFTAEINTEKTQIELLEWESGNNEIVVVSPNGSLYKFMPQIEPHEMFGRRGYINHPKHIEEDLFSIGESVDPNDISYNYVPYRMDSEFEQHALQAMLKLAELQDLEMYFNGYKDNKLESFWIQTPRGRYTPDFLILKRRDNKPYRKGDKGKTVPIEKVIIIETKGKPYYDNEFKTKEKFVKDMFLKHNPHFNYHCFVDEGKNDFSKHLDKFKQLLNNF